MTSATGITQALIALVTAVGAAGYLYILGGAILWARLRGAGWPTEVPISLASRSELIVVGAQTLAVLIVLVALLTALTLATTRSGLPAWWIVVGVVVGFSLGLTLHGVFDHDINGLIAFCAVAVVVVAVAAAMFQPSLAWLIGLGLIIAGGGASAWATSILIQDVRPSSVGLVWATFAGVLVVARSLQVAFNRREANLAAVRNAEDHVRNLTRERESLEGLSADDPRVLKNQAAGRTASMFAAGVRGKLGVPMEGQRRSIWRWGRWIALAAAALLLLGGVAVAAQLDEEHDFNRAVVRMDNGRCLHGAYLGQDDKRVVLGGRAQPGVPRRVAVIPLARVKALRIQSPRREAAALVSRRCLGGTLPATPTAPGTPPAATTTVVQGQRGPAGRRGPPGSKASVGLVARASAVRAATRERVGSAVRRAIGERAATADRRAIGERAATADRRAIGERVANVGRRAIVASVAR